jgi:hypothetical protein
VAPQSNITPNAKNAQSWALSTGILAFGAYFVRDYSCLLPTDSIDFKLGNGFDGRIQVSLSHDFSRRE